MAENFERPDKVEIKQFTTNCLNMSGGTSPVTLYLGHPMRGSHPLAFQSKSLSSRGFSIPEHVMESFKKLADIAEKNNVAFVELCDYVIKEVELGKSLQEDSKKASEISENTDDADLKSTQLIEDSSASKDNDQLLNESSEADSNQQALSNEQTSKTKSLDQQPQNLQSQNLQWQAQLGNDLVTQNPDQSQSDSHKNDQTIISDNSLPVNEELQTNSQGKSLFNKVSKKTENQEVDVNDDNKNKKDN
ncbi:MAG: DUF2610 domain-containing protein [Alphaproteobacteria bacterium]